MDIEGGEDVGAHACCKRAERKKSLWSYFAAVLSAFLACLCCSVPLIPLMLGLSAGSTFLSLMRHHLIFDVLGGLMLLGSLIWIWREHKMGEQSVWKNKQFWTCLVLTFLMYGIMNTFIKHVIFPKLATLAGEKTVHQHH
ncbi:MAG: hypothetical protein K2Y32_11990 [Candidatus Obscuribacterales bacterium]|jgi:hypothetical protein|nr:hypothetical protein [Candidatus Obscuribacterales bacterium]